MPMTIYDRESTPETEFMVRRVECRNAESVFLSTNQTSLNGFKTLAAE